MNQNENFDRIDGEETTSAAEQTLLEVYRALSEKGYNPITQIVGYLLTEDPTYITNYSNARALIRRVDRDELLDEIVRYYFEHR
ncbi:MAG: IreB family regulatory phosphoprotein [Clostridia bacterium]|nr:IreB family regulatory phosphoprotein [Clostridia bacterium]